MSVGLLILIVAASHAQTLKRIVVGVNRDYPPYEFLDPSGHPNGFNVDIVKAAAKEASLDVVLRSDDWSRLRAELDRGDIDALAGMLYSRERAGRYEFAAPYLSVDYSIFVRKGAASISSFEDLKNLKVLVEAGSLMHDELSLKQVGNILAVDSEPEALRRLASGVGDVALVPLLAGRLILEQERIEGIEPSGAPIASRKLCFATGKGESDTLSNLNTGLTLILRNGTYDRIYQKWFGHMSPPYGPWASFVGAWPWILGTVALGLLIATTWVATLKRQVRQRTADLNAELAERNRVTNELRLNEEKYRGVVEQASDGIFVADETFCYIDVNDAGCAMLGYSRDELIGKEMTSFLEPESLARNPIDKARLASGLGTVRERIFLRKDGSRLFVEINGKRSSSGLYIGIVRDITERKREEQRLVQMNEELEDRVWDRTIELESAYKELESFSYSVAHDLRSPLRAMNGYAGMIIQDHGETVPEEARQYLERIRANSQKMGQLIDSLLSYARMSRVPLELQELSVEECVREVWKDLVAERDVQTITLTIHSLPPAIADPTLFKLLIGNLLSNAIKFTRDTVDPQIEVGYDEAESAYYVKDNGAGFDPQYKDKLFRVFERLHTAEFEGTGVGLAIVKRIVDRHGGYVFADGAIGQGAKLSFTVNGAKKSGRVTSSKA